VPRAEREWRKTALQDRENNTPFFIHFQNCKTQNLNSNSEIIHPNTFTKVPEARITHFLLKKVKESRWRRATVARRRLSSNRASQRPIQVKTNTIQLPFMSGCFLGCLFASFRTESWVWFLILKTCSLRFWFSEMICWKLIVYSCSTWKNEANHVWFVCFCDVFVTPVTGVVTGTVLARRRRRPTCLLSFSPSLKRVR
jgi:hypothetical protein